MAHVDEVILVIAIGRNYNIHDNDVLYMSWCGNTKHCISRIMSAVIFYCLGGSPPHAYFPTAFSR